MRISSQESSATRPKPISPHDPNVFHPAATCKERITENIDLGLLDEFKAVSALTRVNNFADDGTAVNRRLTLIDGLATTIKASRVPALMKIPNLIVTPDVAVHVDSYSSNQLWPYETGVSKAWSGYDALQPGNVPKSRHTPEFPPGWRIHCLCRRPRWLL